jgi:hypothetical protein
LSDGQRSLIEFPTDWMLDDFPHYDHNRSGTECRSPRRNGHTKCSAANSTRRGNSVALWISVWHLALSGRLARFKAALELLDYMWGKRFPAANRRPLTKIHVPNNLRDRS